MKNKKGELTSNQLITIIILIISFAIIVAFFFMLGLKSTIDKETCRNSVITRGALPMGKDAVQLKCKSQDICLSMGGDCDVQRKDMVTIKVNNENELTKEMVNLLYDCWWMMGEGKVDYLSSVIGFNEKYCSICNNVRFDSEIQKKYKDGISYSKLYSYMKSNKVPNKDESYLFYLYGLNSLDSVKDNILKGSGYDIYQAKIDPKQDHVVIMAEVKSGLGNWLPAGGALAGKLASALIIGKTGLGIGTAAGSVLPVAGNIAVGAAGLIAGTAIGLVISNAATDTTYISPTYLEFSYSELNALGCEEYVSEG